MTMESNVLYMPDVFASFPDVEELWPTLPWDQRTEARKECFFNERGTDYTYGGGVGVRTYSPAGQHLIPAWVRACWKHVEEHYGTAFEACFINGYEHHRQHLGWHADDSDMINHEQPIVVVSFGAKREIWTREDGCDEVKKWPLDHGSIFEMPAGFQQTHVHRIPKHSATCGKRISLTFRALV